MHHKRHDAGSQDIILHPSIPGGPQPLNDIEVGVVFRNFVKLAPVRRGRRESRGIPEVESDPDRVRARNPEY